jgi:hypothetical protein
MSLIRLLADLPKHPYLIREPSTQVKSPETCAGKLCFHGGEKQKDCSCKCTDGWEGDDCNTCPLSTNSCGERGVFDATSCSVCYSTASQ